jgi:surfeit locus 1 family protein
MLLVLIGLGTWQVYRLYWKEGILAQISAAEASPPVPLGPEPAPFMKVSVSGRFLYDLAAQYGVEVRDTPAGTTIGSYQIVPLQRDGAPTILVNRGWIPDKRDRPLNDPPGEVTVAGYVRPGDRPNWFSPADDLAVRHFYTLDPDAMAQALELKDVLPFVLVALGPETFATYPAPASHLPRPPNNHLSYAITWYGLAVVLVVMFAAWVRKAVRQ